MPAKPKAPSATSSEPTSAKSARKSAGSSASESAKSESAGGEKPEGRKKSSTISTLRASGTLDLLEEKPKKTRESRTTAAAAMPKIGQRKAAAPPASAEPEPPKPSQLDEQKKNALSLFDEEEKKAERAKQRESRKKEEAEKAAAAAAAPKPTVLPAISRILQEKEEKKEADKAALTAIFQKTTQAVHTTEPTAEEAPSAPVPVIEEPAAEADAKIIHLKPPIIVRDLAERIGLKGFKLVAELMEMDIFVNQNQSIEPEVAARVCEKHGYVFEREKREKGAGIHKEEKPTEPPQEPAEEKKEEMLPRPPIITVMGHVDHGKTSLLDAIRKTRVAAGEAGGITQHIGAYSVNHAGHTLTFLDTPGHAAFTQMRARGAHLTDIVILVVAADDGLMPQTIESIAHAKAAGVQIVVALNKIDLATANPDRVKAQLQEHGLQPEDWGGSTAVMPVSALKGAGISELLEHVLLEAEVLELTANPSAPCRAIIVESRIEPGKGPTATVIPRTGTLKTGASFLCGALYGKVKGMLNDSGQPVKEAGPATPAEVIGFSAMPNVGDELVVMDDREAKRMSEQRLGEQRLEKLAAPRRATLETLFSQIAEGEKLSLRAIVKTDVQGSLEAILGQLQEIKSDKIKLEVLHSAVGPISENDVLLASASNAIIIGFGTKVEGKAVKVAKAEGVQIKLYSIIYELLDQVKEAMLGMLAPETREKVIGHALVKQVFKINRGRVGGCVVQNGRIIRSARARVLRGKEKVPVYDGGFHTLRRFTEDVSEVRQGLECGIRLGDFNDYEEGDVIECYELEKIAQSL